MICAAGHACQERTASSQLLLMCQTGELGRSAKMLFERAEPAAAVVPQAEAGSFKSLNTTWDTTVYDTVRMPVHTVVLWYVVSTSLYLHQVCELQADGLPNDLLAQAGMRK